MTEEKKKAVELVERFDKAIRSKIVCSNNPKFGAKQCALICVDEILDDDMQDMSEEKFNERIEFWQNVKEEIEKL